MPQERHNPFPYAIASEVEATEGSREAKAARNVVSRHVGGIPKRSYLLGQSDHAPILAGVRDLAAAAYAVIDTVDWNQVGPEALDACGQLKAVLEHHGCPEQREFPEAAPEE